MKTKNYQIIILMMMTICLSLKLFPQPGTLTLTFSGDNNGQPVTLESVWVKNLTQNCDTTLYPPDFTLVIDTIMTGITNHGNSGNDFTVSQNFPNPFIDQTTISIYLPEKDDVEIRVTNLLGQQVANYNYLLNGGHNTFKFSPGNERVYLMSVNYKKTTKTIRMLYSGNGNLPVCKLSYKGNEGGELNKSAQFNNYFDFNSGDQLLFVGYTSLVESGFLDSPVENQDYVFQFATNIPCIGGPIVVYEGQTYNTIQIFSQCWFKENLNVGVMIPSSQSQTNNDTIEKYCMSDNEYHCNNFAGGLYFWSEMMKYTNETGGQGICPEGWHIPDDLDWQILEGAVDSEYKIGNPEWENYDWRGTDAGGNLKQTGTTNWIPPNTGATDAFGFTALPGGYFVQGGFWGPGYKVYFWSSDIVGKFYRNIDCDQAMIKREIVVTSSLAISVRCVKD